MRGRVVAPECGGGYDVESSQITLRNESGDIIGTATTSDNRIDIATSPPVCVVDFKIAEVPDAKFYTLKIGTHEGPAWSKEELSRERFRPQLTLGDAEMPAGTEADVCSALDDLHATLLNTRLLNRDALKWTGQINALGDRLGTYAAALDLKGNESVVFDVDQLASSASRFQYDGWAPVETLNKKVGGLNGPATAITVGTPCTWEPVSYH